MLTLTNAAPTSPRTTLLNHYSVPPPHSCIYRDQSCIAWSGISKTIPVLLFFPEAAVSKDGKISSTGGLSAESKSRSDQGSELDSSLDADNVFPLLRALPFGLQDCAHREPPGTRNTHQSRLQWGNVSSWPPVILSVWAKSCKSWLFYLLIYKCTWVFLGMRCSTTLFISFDWFLPFCQRSMRHQRGGAGTLLRTLIPFHESTKSPVPFFPRSYH